MSILRTYVAKLRWCRHFPQSKFAILYLPLRTAHFAAGPIVDFATAKMDQNKTSRFCKNGQKWTKTRPADSLDIHQYLANLYLPWPTAYFYSLDIHQYLANLYLPWPPAHFYSLDMGKRENPRCKPGKQWMRVHFHLLNAITSVNLPINALLLT